MLVLEAVEHARLHEAAPRFICIFYGIEFEEDENVVRVVDHTEDPLHTLAFSRALGRS
jgi:hypothetical protein